MSRAPQRSTPLPFCGNQRRKIFFPSSMKLAPPALLTCVKQMGVCSASHNVPSHASWSSKPSSLYQSGASVRRPRRNRGIGPAPASEAARASDALSQPCTQGTSTTRRATAMRRAPETRAADARGERDWRRMFKFVRVVCVRLSGRYPRGVKELFLSSADCITIAFATSGDGTTRGTVISRVLN
eukprot:scaffold7643_cov267-Pinguiococcus_pyrenoidosus.AAC.2